MERISSTDGKAADAAFSIGSQKYTVRMATENERIEFNNERCLALSFEESQEIIISPMAMAEARLYITMHQISRSHLFVGPMPVDANSICNFVASVATQAFHDLEACGGELALQRLLPGQILRARRRHEK